MKKMKEHYNKDILPSVKKILLYAKPEDLFLIIMGTLLRWDSRKFCANEWFFTKTAGHS